MKNDIISAFFSPIYSIFASIYNWLINISHVSKGFAYANTTFTIDFSINLTNKLTVTRPKIIFTIFLFSDNVCKYLVSSPGGNCVVFNSCSYLLPFLPFVPNLPKICAYKKIIMCCRRSHNKSISQKSK